MVLFRYQGKHVLHRILHREKYLELMIGDGVCLVDCGMD